MAVFVAAAALARSCANDNETVRVFLLDVRGQAAALAGVPLAANPYPKASFEAACWSAGWLAGECEMTCQETSAQPQRARPPAIAMETLAV